MTTVISGTLAMLSPPRPLIVIAKGWSSALVVAVLLGLPVECAYLDLNLLAAVIPWFQQHGVLVKSLAEVATLYLSDTFTVVVSGPVLYVKEELSRHLDRLSFVIWIVEDFVRSKSRSVITRGYSRAESVCRDLGLDPVRFPHASYGGATSGLHVIGFSPSLGLRHYSHPPNVRRSLRHFWKPAEALKSPISLMPPPPLLEGDYDRPVKLKPTSSTSSFCLRLEGLLPVTHPRSLCCGPTVFYPSQFVRRRLTREELLNIFDVPTALHSSLLDEFTWNATSPLPFEASVSPVILTTVFRELWSGPRGGSADSFSPLPAMPRAVTEVNVGQSAYGASDLGDELNIDQASTESIVGQPVRGASDLGDRLKDSVPSAQGAPNLGVDLGITLLPNPTPCTTDEISDQDSCTSASSLSNETFDTYRSFDTSSAEDSFMPRKRKKDYSVATTEFSWESLDDVSIDTTTDETDDSSVPSLAMEDEDWTPLSHLVENAGPDQWSDSDSASSVASAATIVTAPKQVLEAVNDLAIGKKAVKADDASVPEWMWNMRARVDHLDEAEKLKFLANMRSIGLSLFRRALYADCMEYLELEFGIDWQAVLVAHPEGTSKWKSRLLVELDAIRNILWHASETSWFEYLAGSKLHHFRFPLRYRKLARDGVPTYFEKEGPQSKQRQPDIKPEMKEAVRAKILKVIRKRYLVKVRTSLDIKSLIKFFAVPKGEKDIRMVYDATASGLNAAVWAPPFWLPTIDSLTRSLQNTSWMTDRDVGDMFLNFPLHKSARPFAGVDIKPILNPDDPDQHRWYQWARNAMGFAPSPHDSVMMALVVEEVIKGDRFDPKNPFQWKFVRLNMPGTQSYDPSEPWIMKVRADELSAAVIYSLFTFVDDERVAGATDDNTWEASHAVGSGIQTVVFRHAGCCSQGRYLYATG